MAQNIFFGAILSLMVGNAQQMTTILLLLLVFIYLKHLVDNTATKGWYLSKDTKSLFQSCLD